MPRPPRKPRAPASSLRLRHGSRPPQKRQVLYEPGFVKPADRDELMSWLSTLYPIWEQRFSTVRPLPSGEQQRQLLRPVYWLGNWQFACLDYYRPPSGLLNRCIRAEPFPPVLRRLVAEIEAIARATYAPKDLPRRWTLNTCLVNFYGTKIHPDGKREDTARVGEHKDFEPGPVGSLSLGERALFQFVSSERKGQRTDVILQQWLDDGSLQVFGGSRWKNELFHRVQRVDRRDGTVFDVRTPDFETRRINFTFRYVPDEHIVAYEDLPETVARDIDPYVSALAEHSNFFAAAKTQRAQRSSPPVAPT